MSELPSSWNLSTRLNGAGKCEVWGKDDTGHDYKVRTCDSGGITERDVEEIAAVDREHTNAKEYMDRLTAYGKQLQRSRESEFQDDLEDAAGPVVRAGLERAGSTTGYSRTYAQGYDRWMGGH